MNQKLENNDSPLGKGNKYTSFSLEPLFHPQLIIHELTLEVEIILTKIDDYSFGCSSWQILNLYKKLGKQFLQKRGDRSKQVTCVTKGKSPFKQIFPSQFF